MTRKRGAKRGQTSSHPFVALYFWLLSSDAWSDLSPNARSVYIALKTRFNGKNNGCVAFSALEAGKAIGREKDTGNRALAELIDHGFIEVTARSSFTRKTREATEYLLTEYPDDRPGQSRIPARNFMRWQADEIQNTVASMRVTVAPVRAMGSQNVG